MTSLFLSYSRRESPFIDALADKLQDHHFEIWLDYRSLVPAQPWEAQIFQGIDQADIFILVVSKNSMASKNVEKEWKYAIEKKKRIVLVLFQSTKLPPELAQYEWVDFRAAFENSVAKLTTLLKNPAKQPEQPAPQTGFKSPPVVWASVAAGIIVAILAVPTFWTLYIPYHLVPLPYRILKRNFNFFQVQTALVMLPFALLLTLGIFLSNAPDDDPIFMVVGSACLLVPLFFVTLVFLIRSAGMQRWGKPIASRPMFADPHIPNIDKPKPTRFTIESAPEDAKYAAEIQKTLEEYGHINVTTGKDAEATLVLISTYNNSTSLNPEIQPVFPILIQANENIDNKLQKVQWIDFRRGLKNLDALAQLLPEPAKLLVALGVAPTGDQIVLPRIIQSLVNFLTVLAVFSIGSWAIFLLQLSPEISETAPIGEIACLMIFLGLFFALIFFTVRALTHRRGKLTSPYLVISVIVLLGVFIIAQFFAVFALQESIGVMIGENNESRGGSVAVGFWAYLIGIIIIIPLTLNNWKSFLRWFPAKAKKGENNG